MESRRAELREHLLRAGATLAGLADISDLRMDGFKRAVAVAIAYPPEMVEHLDHQVRAFHDLLKKNREQMAGLLSLGAEWIKAVGFNAYIPEISTTLPGLTGEFSHKTAAVRAGLGWIGKNALLVNENYGCGFRLGSILTDADWEADEPVLASGCGECSACAEACPYGAILGTLWKPGMPREQLLDARKCHEAREAFTARLGFKPPCGFCIQACPRGR